MAYLLLAWSVFGRTGTLARAFSVTVFLAAGLFMLPANVVYFFYVNPQSARIEEMLKRDPATFHASEEAQLTKSGLFENVWRQGDNRVTPDALTLHVNLQGFKKGQRTVARYCSIHRLNFGQSQRPTH